MEEEKLEGENQYYCENCDGKKDALIGQGFTSFPYILTLHLRRFDFDFINMERVKLNDEVSFPEILDMNPFIYGSPLNISEQEDNEEFGDEEKRMEKIELYLDHGPYVYELFSVLIHSGTAHGGHYYGYVKSFNTHKWYCFNDSSVTSFDPKKIPSSFGNGEKGSGSNAYMLMYRQYDPSRNIIEPSIASIPEEVFFFCIG